MSEEPSVNVEGKTVEPSPREAAEVGAGHEKQPIHDSSSEDSIHSDAEKGLHETTVPEADSPPVDPEADAHVYPPKEKVILIMAALYMAFFLVALDRTIIATAIPQITDAFHSLDDVGWYGSAYMLTASAFLLIFGRIYTFYNPKTVFLLSIACFEVGSAICGAAPNSIAFIVGRAIAGLGSAGVMSGAIVIIVYVVPLHKRPLWQGLIGAVFGLASVAGPLLGGAFTTNVSWRWCFYINLPIGGVAMVILVFILKLPMPKNERVTLRQQISQLDPIGTSVFIPGIVCLLLALQWGGSTYSWQNARIIVLLILFVLLMIAFVAVQIWKNDLATVPPRIVKQRSMIAGMWAQFCVGSSMFTFVYYVPIWFQAIKDVSAVKSGIMNLPLLLSLVIASIMAGATVGRIGYYTPFMIASSVIMSIGAGLMTTWTSSTGHSEWIGYQFVFGYGLGLGMQQATIAAQAVLPRKDVPTGISCIMFCQQIGGAIFVSVSQNVFTNKLVQGLGSIPGLNPQAIVNIGATELRNHVAPQSLSRVLSAYNGALVATFQVGLAMACLSVLGTVAMEWKSVKKPKVQGAPVAKEEAVKEKADMEAIA